MESKLALKKAELRGIVIVNQQEMDTWSLSFGHQYNEVDSSSRKLCTAATKGLANGLGKHWMG